jgi:hypothetical protein
MHDVRGILSRKRELGGLRGDAGRGLHRIRAHGLGIVDHGGFVITA